ncbi:MAG: undecaprenyl/decaprenyl-phosphate alpha-N-acetylglucosaminyl 1-phosphate transferase [Endomicrobiales bacterium]|nr:undecaprenyl/decaprenyl-phosphate alpha-N-acetylglucosaminyl 1-phosphate transferase [Endomicrobiales bacterium]
MNSSKNAKKAYYVLLILTLIFLLQPKGGTWAWLLGIRWIYLMFLGFVWAQILTPITIKLGWKFGILDHPTEERKIHKEPIPRIGGLAIFLAIILSNARNFQFSPQLLGLLVGSSLIYLIGLIDDIHPLSATSRIIAQIIACLIVIKSGVTITFIPVGFPGEKIIEGFVTAFWLIGLANALNFLDGVDGLAAGLGAVCSFLFFFIALPTEQKHLTYLTISITGACLGFLPFNWKPARVFLGDAGATFLGFLIAGIAVMGSWGYNNPMVALSTPLLILGIPIFDMIYTTISRIYYGHVRTFVQWLEYAARDHFHHRLMHLGLSEKHTVLFILMVNLCLGLGAIVIRNTGTLASILLLTQSVIIFLIITVLMLLGKKKTKEKSEKIMDILKQAYKGREKENNA